MEASRTCGFSFKAASVLLLFGNLLELGVARITPSVKSDVQGLEYLVGGCRGWEHGNDFKKWAFDNPVHVGDALIFRYPNKHVHSVLRLQSEEHMNECNFGDTFKEWPWEAKFGGSRVTLDEAGTLYLACPVWCSTGMKFEIDVLPRPQPPQGTAEPQGSTSEEDLHHVTGATFRC